MYYAILNYAVNLTPSFPNTFGGWIRQTPHKTLFIPKSYRIKEARLEMVSRSLNVLKK